ncbi:vesicle-associated protein 1-2-like, partial [Trifolium medium]|nr:vesicle-associated protein 1-2-like [Trifolium medium]
HNDAPPNMQGEDKIIVEVIYVRDGAIVKNITPEMFEKESGYEVKECEVIVVYGVSPIPPSSVQE